MFGGVRGSHEGGSNPRPRHASHFAPLAALLGARAYMRAPLAFPWTLVPLRETSGAFAKAVDRYRTWMQSQAAKPGAVGMAR
jgi:hypothetical protein